MQRSVVLSSFIALKSSDDSLQKQQNAKRKEKKKTNI
jgi:hypothetical protein